MKTRAWTALLLAVMPGQLACRCTEKADAQGPAKVAVRVAFPGASPAEVEQTLALGVEETLGTVQQAVSVESICRPGQLLCLVEGRGPAEAADPLLGEVHLALQRIASVMPYEVDPPAVWALRPSQGTSLVSLSGTQDPADLAELGRRLRSGLLELPGVRLVERIGVASSRVVVEIDARKLQLFGLSGEELAQAIRTADLDLPGSASAGVDGLLLRIEAKPMTQDELGRIQVGRSQDRPVLLRDLARIRQELGQPGDAWVLTGAGPGLALRVSWTAGARQPALRQALERFRAQARPGLQVQRFDLHAPGPGSIQDRGLVEGWLALPAGTGAEQRASIAHKLAQQLAGIPESQAFVLLMRTAEGKGWREEADGLLHLRTPSPEAARLASQRLREALARIPGLRAHARARADGQRLADLEIAIRGPDRRVLVESAERVRARLESLPAIGLVIGQGLEQLPELRIELDRERLASLGLSTARVSAAIRLAMHGERVFTLYSAGQALPVELRMAARRDPLDSLQSINLRTPAGEQVPLASLAKLIQDLAPGELLRIDGQPAVRLRAFLQTSLDGGPEALERSLARDLGPAVQVRVGSSRR
ncbi:MAG: efflux RND transporter permease subunit [Deltaproteobacteria bacterium]|nr:efflux RND transporter permease subunit [Deltaproteobacteria bacterium]